MGFLSRNNVPEIKYLPKLRQQKSKRTHWIPSFIRRHTSESFDSLGTEKIAHKVLSKIKVKCITHNILT